MFKLPSCKVEAEKSAPSQSESTDPEILGSAIGESCLLETRLDVNEARFQFNEMHPSVPGARLPG